MCLRHENRKDLYHIALSVAKYIAFYVTKYIAQARLYIAIVKSPEASQGADILPIEQIYKGGVPLFEEGKEHDRRRWRKQGVWVGVAVKIVRSE